MYTRSGRSANGAGGEPASRSNSSEAAACPPAWAADAPLLAGERGVHIASRIGIVAVEAGALRRGELPGSSPVLIGQPRPQDRGSAP
jgi:hypothetical protein